MVSPLHRLLVAALVVTGLCVLSGAAVAVASPAPRLGNAVAVGAGSKPSGIAGICARRAKRKVLRSSSRVTASAQAAPKSHAAGARMKRRAQVLRRRCLKNLRRHSRPSTATQSVPLPEAGPLTLAIDGGYGDWSETELEEREALGAAVTRHEWDVSEPVEDRKST